MRGDRDRDRKRGADCLTIVKVETGATGSSPSRKVYCGGNISMETFESAALQLSMELETIPRDFAAEIGYKYGCEVGTLCEDGRSGKQCVVDGIPSEVLVAVSNIAATEC